MNVVRQSLNHLIWTQARRHLLTPSYLGIDQFQQQVNIRKERFGKNVDEFRAQFVERLTDPEADILTQDCLSYIYLMEESDLSGIDQILERHYKQSARDKQMGVNKSEAVLANYAVRKCYLLNNAAKALEIFNSEALDSQDAVSSLAVLMDLLYRNNMHAECAEFPFKHIIDKHQLNVSELQPLLTLAFLSAYNLASTAGLATTIKLCNHWMTIGRRAPPYRVQSLTALYAVERGRINLACDLLSGGPASFWDTIIRENVRTLAYIKAGNDHRAFQTVGQLNASVRRYLAAGDTYTKKDRQAKRRDIPCLLFNDVFKELIQFAKKSDHVALMERIRSNMAALVHEQTLSSYLTQRLRNPYSAHKGYRMKIPSFDDQPEDIPLNQELPDLDAAGTDSKVSQPNVQNTANSQTTQPKKASNTKLSIVNGYIVFTEEDDAPPT